MGEAKRKKITAAWQRQVDEAGVNSALVGYVSYQLGAAFQEALEERQLTDDEIEAVVSAFVVGWALTAGRPRFERWHRSLPQAIETLLAAFQSAARPDEEKDQ